MQATNQIIDEIVNQFAADDPSAFATFCEAVREGNPIKTGTIFLDFASDYLRKYAPEQDADPSPRLERQAFSPSGRPVVHSDFTRRDV